MSEENPEQEKIGGYGLSLGAVIAVVISWSIHESVLLAIIHGLLGWFYVIYAIIMYYGSY